MSEELIENVKIITKENDFFNTYDKALSIVKFLELEENQRLISKNNLIAIYGPWGSGKSSLMKTIENNINSKKFETIWYDTWKYETDDNVPYSLLKYILRNDKWECFKEKGEKFLDNIYDLFKGFSKGVEFNLGLLTVKPGDTLETIQASQSKAPNLTIWEKYQEFKESFAKITFNDKKLIVFLDDLDRCDSQNIISLISSIKQLLSINKNIIFIIGIDKEAVSKALSNKYNNDYNKAEEYLEKIFSINFNIIPKTKYETISPNLSELLSLSINDTNIILDFFDKIQFNNPRHIKKVIRKYWLVKTYLNNNNVNLENKIIVIIILYFVILNNFYPDEYMHIGLDSKINIYREISLISQDSKTVVKKSSPFLNYHVTCYLNNSQEKSINIFPLLQFFSSYKLQKKEINCIKYLSGEGMIQLNDWQMLFADNICSRFIDFLLSDTTYYEAFIEENEIDIKLLNDLFMKINNII